MKTALPTARALALEGPAPDPWITLNRSESTYFADSVVQRSEATSVQLSPDTYLITRADRGGIFGNAARMKADVIQEANEFAASQGKVAIPLSTKESPMFPGHFAEIEYQFRVVGKDDPEYRRTELVPRPDVVVQEEKKIDVTVDDKRGDSAPTKDAYTELLKLDDLRSRGILTEEEFQEQKRRILTE